MPPSEPNTDGAHAQGDGVNPPPATPVVLPPPRGKLAPNQAGLRIGGAGKSGLGKAMVEHSRSNFQVRKIGAGPPTPAPSGLTQAADTGGLVIAVPSDAPQLLVKGLRWRRLPAQVPWKIPAIFMFGLLAVIAIKLYQTMG